MESNNKGSVRSKLETFFNPNPTKSGKSSIAKQTDLEDPLDPYSHTHKFFKGDKKTDSYADTIEIGTRRIRGDITEELDEKVYGGTKVSRDALQGGFVRRMSVSSQDDSKLSEGSDDDMEEGEDDMEEGEDSMEEDSGVDEDMDEELESDTQVKAKQFMSKLRQDYSDDEEEQSEGGHDEEEKEEDESDIEDDLDNDGSMSDTQKKARQFMKGGDASSENDEDEDGDDIDKALKQLKEEEKNESKFYQSRVSSEVEKGKSVRVQKKVFDQLLHQRILMQKLLQTANRLPQSQTTMRAFTLGSTKLKEGLTKCRRELKTYIKDVTQLQKELFTLSETTVSTKPIPDQYIDNESTADSIYSILDSNFKATLPFIEETVERWNTRTQMLSGNTKSNAQSHQNKSILEQVTSLLGESENQKRLLERVRVKNGQKVFGKMVSESMNNANEKHDLEIYNDQDFYQLMLKDFLATNDTTTGGADYQQEEADGADLGLTQKYLERKRKLQEANQGMQVKKEVDRKASKNRKIRYVVHEKLLNFMAPQDNHALTEGAQAILLTLFGAKPARQEETVLIGKKRNQREDHDDIQLI